LRPSILPTIRRESAMIVVFAAKVHFFRATKADDRCSFHSIERSGNSASAEFGLGKLEHDNWGKGCRLANLASA
jgi:hypothetical protein